MRYAQGGGLTAEGRRRREQVRLVAVQWFERRVPGTWYLLRRRGWSCQLGARRAAEQPGAPEPRELRQALFG